jgi:hypothetical protein
MSKTTISLKLAVTVILKILADLSLVVTVERAYNFGSGEVSGHGIVQITFLTETVRK